MSDAEKDKTERSYDDYKSSVLQIMAAVDGKKMSLKEACEKWDMPVRFMRYVRKQQKAKYDRLKQKVDLLQVAVNLQTMIAELEVRNSENPVEGVGNDGKL